MSSRPVDNNKSENISRDANDPPQVSRHKNDKDPFHRHDKHTRMGRNRQNVEAESKKCGDNSLTQLQQAHDKIRNKNSEQTRYVAFNYVSVFKFMICVKDVTS